MAGVAGPMLRRSGQQGTRFLLGLLMGGLLASALLASLLFGLGSALDQTLSSTTRTGVAGCALFVFGLLDAANRTPHIWRQVPQALVRVLPPWRLGAVWGFDLSLLFTTQKTTSLTWAAVVGTMVVARWEAWVVMIGMTIISVATIALRSVLYAVRGPALTGDGRQAWFLWMRRAAGLVLVVIGIAMVVEARG